MREMWGWCWRLVFVGINAWGGGKPLSGDNLRLSGDKPTLSGDNPRLSGDKLTLSGDNLRVNGDNHFLPLFFTSRQANRPLLRYNKGTSEGG